jgi:prepilin-type N-terminal cleavage/methylation domain-containing protein
MRRQRGFSLMEIVLSLAVTLVVLVAFLTVFSNSNKLAVASRNRSVAIVLAQGLMDDIEAHTYGNPEPVAWTLPEESPVTVWVGHREQKMTFHRTLGYENGSFVGQGPGEHDVVTITISWREEMGDRQTGAALPSNPTSGDDNKQLEVRVPVWR